MQRSLTVTATGVDKVYDGTAAATVALSDNRVVGDVFTNNYTSASFADKNVNSVGSSKTVTVSGISISGADAANFSLFNTTATTTADITTRSITVKADDKSKLYSASDPPLTYQITSGNLVIGDTLSGGLTRVAGELPWTYAINIGTLTAGSNYKLTFVSGVFTIGYGTCNAPVGTGGVILPPINADGVYRKAGSTLPVKFRVCD
jgi:large repetitive protein